MLAPTTAATASALPLGLAPAPPLEHPASASSTAQARKQSAARLAIRAVRTERRRRLPMCSVGLTFLAGQWPDACRVTP